MKTIRIPYLDNIKGFLIILVVLGHVLQYTYDIDCIIDRYIYSFHMPLFMAVSGYCSYKVTQNWNTIKKRAIQLLIPFITWAFVVSLLENDITYIWTITEYPDRGLWFLQALFFISSIVAVVSKCKGRFYTCLFLIWLFTTGVSMGLGIKTFGIPMIGWHLPFYTLGYAMKQYNFIERVNTRILLICLFIWAILGYWCSENQLVQIASLFIGSVTLQHVVYRLLSMLIAVFAILGWFGIFHILLNKYERGLTFLGRKTLSIYSVTLSTELFLFAFIRPYTSQLSYPIEVVILVIFLICFSLCIDWILSKNRYTSMLFLGKRIK